MGCIVNGPGEMADADFGYVGGAPGKIDLYVGKVYSMFLLFHLYGFSFRRKKLDFVLSETIGKRKQ